MIRFPLEGNPRAVPAQAMTQAMVEAALSAFYGRCMDHESPGNCMRAALTAALAAQPAQAEAPAQAVEASPAARDVLAERARQDVKWGGQAHDDEHSAEDWERFIMKRIPINSEMDASYRKRMVEIAALAIAAVESHDRKALATQPTEASK